MTASFYYIRLVSSTGSAAAFRVIRARPIASSTVSSLPSVVSIPLVKWVSANAMCLSRITAAKSIFNGGYGFEMNRIYTMPSSAEMVKHERLGKSPHENSIRYSMSYWGLVFSQLESTVALFVSKTSPQPAGNAFKGYSRIDANLRKESGKKFSVCGKFVRVITEHLSLLIRFDGLGCNGFSESLCPSILA